MCRGVNRDSNEIAAEYQQPADQVINPLPGEEIQWPFGDRYVEWLWSCRGCAYPIARIPQQIIANAFFGYPLNEHYAVVSRNSLQTEDFAGEFHRFVLHVWERRIYCFHCMRQLSFTRETIHPSVEEHPFTINDVILDRNRIIIGDSTNLRRVWQRRQQHYQFLAAVFTR